LGRHARGVMEDRDMQGSTRRVACCQDR
jgi:hypothetical protein